MKEPTITYTQFKKEIEKYRAMSAYSIQITKEQKEFLIICRSETNKVAWKIMRNLWEGFGWGNLSTTTLRVRYERAIADNNA